ncbi:MULTISPECIES: aconitate hydratase AcnA [unclassified Paenibacillus]|uniref:aconitate hydratase AcnA n=1 Tax=unclassified Paenibacillus TaxID=185978 RepID=UPI001AE946AE|nr:MULTISPECIES: aconitate hydratase AcnA [unclassified Paenibacillus]MBP1155569.1 aconitate hydratase [Paenibacillus sp. PvP091]MBP1169045.1 aconitate hydratase [Paenibacillus sp. PvR098]MBP2440073.1 aconitate hydratase [Paenibacillus sp. PvP052]
MQPDRFNSLIRTMEVQQRSYALYSLAEAELQGFGNIAQLPYSIKILLESLIRNYDEHSITMHHIRLLADWTEHRGGQQEIPFKPGRVVLQDFTGVPAVVDLASMRDAVQRNGGDPDKINPQIPVDLVIDHSLSVESYGRPDSIRDNMSQEYQQNEERYRFLRWAQMSFENFRVVPPGYGIVHQVNLEYLASGVIRQPSPYGTMLFPDSVIGTDSHTTMINGLGILGWGVGGIEAEAAMLGQPLYFVVPQVVGIKLTGTLREGVTATDVALAITQFLRHKGVVGQFIEFYGPGLSEISSPDRATIANMAPEYGATLSYFPPDQETLNYFRLTGRSEEHIELMESYYRKQGLFRTETAPDPLFTDTCEMDLSTIMPSVAGPKRPQDRIELPNLPERLREAFMRPSAQGGYGLTKEHMEKKVWVEYDDGDKEEMKEGSIVIASITSCTNTSNPSVMIGAGLLAQKAVEKGLTIPRFVKTSLTPGSRAVTEYLSRSGLLTSLQALGFYIDGYGCATCCGNSGPLPPKVDRAITSHQLTVASVLSGNRNFEGRIHPLVKMNFLASPPLVIAYALTGTMNIDLTSEPVGYTQEGTAVFLKDIWPSSKEVEHILQSTLTPEIFSETYKDMFQGDRLWNSLSSDNDRQYTWDAASTYIQPPPYFHHAVDREHVNKIPMSQGDGYRAASDALRMRALAVLGDSITTDHISPVGNIAVDSPAGKYLRSRGVERKDYNSYGSRRGNHQVMLRGTFANIRLRNRMVEGKEGGYTRYLPDDELMTIYDAAMKYKESGTPLLVIAGKEYGTGSSRDWAAKGTLLLGVKAVLAESFERIHRSNLVGMGVLPIQFADGKNAEAWGLSGEEEYVLHAPEFSQPKQKVQLEVVQPDGGRVHIPVIVRLDSQVEIVYYRNNGILPYVLSILSS